MKHYRDAFIICCLGLSACGGNTVIVKDKAEGTFCDSTNLCTPGLECVENVCRLLCSGDRDCDSTQVCGSNNYCVHGKDLECAQDSNCNTPPTCRIASGATCVAGHCNYQIASAGTSCDDNNVCTQNDTCNDSGECIGTAVICNDPPSGTCIENDTILRTYSTDGHCEAENNIGCVYSYADQECDNCTINCLNFCLNVHCPDSTGSCHGQMCDPNSTADPPCTIQYKVTGTPCDISEDSGLLDGFCDNNKCYECTEDSHCQNMPLWNECFVAKCQNHHCEYIPKEGLTLCGNRCINGYRYGNGDCSADGLSCSAASTYCKGYQCDDYGIDCLTSCRNNNDCDNGYFCNAKNICQDESSPNGAQPGAACTQDDECRSGLCITIHHHQECATICSSSADCPNNLVCAKIDPRQPNSQSICQLPTQKGCSSCSEDSDCQDHGTLCEEIDGEKVCLGPCSDTADCPLGFVCETISDSKNNLAVKQCLPSINSCKCQPQFDGVKRQCFQSTEGVGTCFGTEECRGKNMLWEGCNAPMPMAEICDGIDNDCDGQTDTNPNGSLLAIDCGYGYDDDPTLRPSNCSGTSYCQNGTYGNCSTAAPSSTDTPCDGIDNDCNGLIDEISCEPGPGKTGVYKYGCSGKTCMNWQCLWPYYDVDGDASNGCEVVDDSYTINGSRYHSNSQGNARNLGSISSSGTSEIHFCNGLLPRDNRINYYSKTITDISPYEGQDFFKFQYSVSLFSVNNLKLRVVADNGSVKDNSYVRVCISTAQSDYTTTADFANCKSIFMSSATNGKASVTFDHADNSDYFSKEGYYFIRVTGSAASFLYKKFTGKYHLQLIEDTMSNDITGSSPACK